MEIIPTELNDCFLIELDIYKDQRGLFFETFQKEKYKNIISPDYDFVQDNFSISRKGVLRGLHFQETKPQGKLIRVSSGVVLDVAVDLRPESDSFGKWTTVILSNENNLQFWIPPRFAHGFLSLSDNVHFEYKCTDYYDSNDERTILWNDPYLGIDWPDDIEISLSDRDEQGKLFKDYNF
jgi:dTDP-4-dehydrorhamnose 3,5-epimerase